jgi:UDP-N-acetyl-D-glucosamine dehydrogenase
MPHYVVERIISALNKHAKPLKGSKILIIGTAYKKDVKDLRESPAIEIISILQNEKAHVSYYDPYLSYLKIDSIDLKSVRFNRKSFSDKDCVVIVTDHSNVDYGFILKHSSLIIDTRNVFKNVKGKKDKVVRL